VETFGIEIRKEGGSNHGRDRGTKIAKVRRPREHFPGLSESQVERKKAGRRKGGTTKQCIAENWRKDEQLVKVLKSAHFDLGGVPNGGEGKEMRRETWILFTSALRKRV